MKEERKKITKDPHTMCVHDSVLRCPKQDHLLIQKEKSELRPGVGAEGSRTGVGRMLKVTGYFLR